MTYGDVASEVGVSERTLWEWRNRNEAFIEKKKELSERGLIEKIDKVNKALVDGAVEGEPRMVKLFYERVGMYVDRKEITGADGGAIEIDAKSELAATIDRIAKRKER